jgi:hypothetical protein
MLDMPAGQVVHIVIHRLFHRQFSAPRGRRPALLLTHRSYSSPHEGSRYLASNVVVRQYMLWKAKTRRKQRQSWAFAERSTNSAEVRFHVKHIPRQHGAAASRTRTDTWNLRRMARLCTCDVHKLIPKVIHSLIHRRVCKLTAPSLAFRSSPIPSSRDSMFHVKHASPFPRMRNGGRVSLRSSHPQDAATLASMG